jgi:molybdate transport system substrate-binding protein
MDAARLLPILLVACTRTSDAVPVRVAAASSLTAAFEAVEAEFERREGTAVELTFGATGQLAQQIEHGAPFDVLAAADVETIDRVVAAGACDAATKAAYGRGRLVLWWREELAAPPTAIAELRDPRFRKVAVANPEHAPYGRAAQQALERAGAWDSVRDRLVLGENVRQALQFAETGNAEVAFTAFALTGTAGNTLPVPEDLYDPLIQALVVCSTGKARTGGQRFADFVRSADGQAILGQHGLDPP